MHPTYNPRVPRIRSYPESCVAAVLAALGLAACDVSPPEIYQAPTREVRPPPGSDAPETPSGAVPDAGINPAPDATESDAGPSAPDAGLSPEPVDSSLDSGIVRDAGAPSEDAGTPPPDAGIDSGIDGGAEEVPPTTVTLERRIAASEDDAEETLATGSMNLGSSDLDMGEDNPPDEPRLVGLRFTQVDIPAGATITQAFLRFTCDEVSTEPSNLEIKAEATDDAAPFSSNGGHLSARSPVAFSIPWPNPDPWETTGSTHQSPDLSALIQAIVDRPGWRSGHALALYVTGSGRREADSFDGSPDAAPLLVVRYETP